MTKTRILASTLLACGLAAAHSYAQAAPAQVMKPGLWELSSKISSSDPAVQEGLAAMRQQLANMPPEQRQQIEQAMRQHGMQVDLGPGGAMRTRMCMTREMIEREEFPVQEGDCRQTTTRVSDTRVKVVFSCTNPPDVSGDGEITVLSDTSYRARMRVRSDHGAAETDVTGKWLGANCGSIPPISIPRAK
jgi:hypothetical protein